MVAADLRLKLDESLSIITGKKYKTQQNFPSANSMSNIHNHSTKWK